MLVTEDGVLDFCWMSPQEAMGVANENVQLPSL